MSVPRGPATPQPCGRTGAAPVNACPNRSSEYRPGADLAPRSPWRNEDPGAAPSGNTANPTALRNVFWEKAYTGLLPTVGEVRRDVRAILGPCPDVVAENAVLVASELAANALRHSRSGGIGGIYVVRVTHYVTVAVPYIWIEVQDLGSPTWDGILRPQPAHGLAVIEQLSTCMGSGDGPNGQRAVYARLEYRSDGTPLYTVARVPKPFI